MARNKQKSLKAKRATQDRSLLQEFRMTYQSRQLPKIAFCESCTQLIFLPDKLLLDHIGHYLLFLSPPWPIGNLKRLNKILLHQSVRGIPYLKAFRKSYRTSGFSLKNPADKIKSKALLRYRRRKTPDNHPWRTGRPRSVYGPVLLRRKSSGSAGSKSRARKKR